MMELTKVKETRSRNFYVYCTNEKKRIAEELTEDEALDLAESHQTKKKHIVEVFKEVLTVVRYKVGKAKKNTGK